MTTEPSPPSLSESSEDGVILEVRADLDVPGETGRQAKIFVVWLACLTLAVILSSSVGAHIPMSASGTELAATATHAAQRLSTLTHLLQTITPHTRELDDPPPVRAVEVALHQAACVDGERRVGGRRHRSPRIARSGSSIEVR